MGLDRLILPVLIVLALTSCGGDAPPRVLFDGTDAGTPPPQFADSVVQSRVDVFRWTEPRPSCPGLRKGVTVIERTGVEGGSLTFRDRAEPGLLGCDDAPGQYELAPWCGVTAGRLYGGRLRDPRLDLCHSRDGRLTGFVWIEPVARAKWIGVDQGSYLELYEVVAELPVRIASRRDVELEGSRARFEVVQYDTRGRELEQATVDAGVAG